eukprot:TRINITY_DN134_c1_g1_i1.p1 TRINITY_DN134_c1_g1~~TRINITY_DN134_c1_g1_i1.p1  ORF type:complete len:1247 (+),score=68.29 TRINITY_DN134_c1_g1_i1:178-3741(+)
MDAQDLCQSILGQFQRIYPLLSYYYHHIELFSYTQVIKITQEKQKIYSNLIAFQFSRNEYLRLTWEIKHSMKYSVLDFQDYVLFFENEWYYRYNCLLKRVDEGPIKLPAIWPDYSACYKVGHLVYFFKGEEFMTYNQHEHRVTSTTEISKKWKLPFKTIKGVIDCPDKDYTYFFSGNEYCCYNKKLNRVDSEKPSPISEWKGMWEDGFDTVGMISNKPYFFKRNKFMTFNLETKEKEGPTEKIYDKWTGVPMLLKHSEEFEHKCGCCTKNCYGKYEGHVGVPCWDRPICCHGVPKKYLCCGKEYVKGHESLAESTKEAKRTAKHISALESKCPDYCQCPPDCRGGDPNAPLCCDRPICCRGWPKHYTCCKKHYGAPGCLFNYWLPRENIHEYTKVYMISDVHLTYDCVTLPIKEGDKGVVLKKKTVIQKTINFVKHLMSKGEKCELVLLGDVFDVWYAPPLEPIEPKEGDDYLGELLRRNEEYMKKVIPDCENPVSQIKEVIKVLNEFTASGNRLVYISGNHDDLIIDDTFKKYISGMCYYRDFYISGNACFTHGNAFDIYNRVFPGYPIPLGRYVTQCACESGVEGVSEITNMILQMDCMKHIYDMSRWDVIAKKFFAKTFEGACKDPEEDKWSFFKRIFKDDCEKDPNYKDKEIIIGKNNAIKIRDVIENYKDLPKAVEEYFSKRGISDGVGLAFQGSAGNLYQWVRRYMRIYQVDYMFMGHTHEPLIAENAKNNKKYLNTGRFPTVIVATRRDGKIVDAELKRFEDAKEFELISEKDIRKDSLKAPIESTYKFTSVVSNKDVNSRLLMAYANNKELPMVVTCQKEDRVTYCSIETKADGENKHNAQIVCGKCKEPIIPYGEPVSDLNNAKELAIGRLLEKSRIYPELQAFVIMGNTDIKNITTLSKSTIDPKSAPVPQYGAPAPPSLELQKEVFTEMKRVKRMLNAAKKQKAVGNVMKAMWKLKNANYFAIKQVIFQLPQDATVIPLVFEKNQVPYHMAIMTPCPKVGTKIEIEAIKMKPIGGRWSHEMKASLEMEYKYLQIEEKTQSIVKSENGPGRTLKIREIQKYLDAQPNYKEIKKADYPFDFYGTRMVYKPSTKTLLVFNMWQEQPLLIHLLTHLISKSRLILCAMATLILFYVWILFTFIGPCLSMVQWTHAVIFDTLYIPFNPRLIAKCYSCLLIYV